MTGKTTGKKTRLPWWKTLGFTLVIVCFLLLMLEAGFRLYAYLKDRHTIESLQQASQRKAKQKAGQTYFLGDIIQISQNPRIIYELIPGLRCMFKSQKIAINRHGFRGPNYPVIKPPGTVRILGLGDSVMFGWGVRQGGSYLELLGNKLNKLHPAVRWQVINTAVPGYNTVMEVETLIAKGLDFSPDIIILGAIGNDRDLPNFIREPADYLSLTRSFLYEFIAAIIRREAYRRNTDLEFAPFLNDKQRFEYRRDRVPEAYRGLVGYPPFKQALERLAAVSRKQGIPVLVFHFMRTSDENKELYRQLGFYILEGKQILDAHMRNHGIIRFRGSELTLSYKDPHPSQIAHILFSQRMYRLLQDSGLVQRLIKNTDLSR